MVERTPLDERSGLREIAQHLTTTAKSGLVLTRQDLSEISSELRLPTGLGDRVQAVMAMFRGAAEGEIRKGLLEDDLFEAVIGLPTNLFYGTGIPAAVLILNKAKKPERRKKVLFIEASREFGEGTAQNFLPRVIRS